MDNQDLINKLKGVQYIVINDCYGGFGLSTRAQQEYRKRAGITESDWCDRDVARDDAYLVQIVRELGMAANGAHSNLKIVEIPGDVDWIIQEYDGAEWIAETHRTWS